MKENMQERGYSSNVEGTNSTQKNKAANKRDWACNWVNSWTGWVMGNGSVMEQVHGFGYGLRLDRSRPSDESEGPDLITGSFITAARLI